MTLLAIKDLIVRYGEIEAVHVHQVDLVARERLRNASSHTGVRDTHGVLVERGRLFAEQADQSARRLQRQENELEQRRLAGAGGAGQELKTLRLDVEAEIVEDLVAHPVA